MRDVDLVVPLNNKKKTIDLVALRALASAADLAIARATVALITDRGYARGRDLETALDVLAKR